MTWKTIRRETGLIEHVCDHGVGHPNAGSITRLDEEGPPGAKGAWGVHGCDGCCGHPDFPGRAASTFAYSLQRYVQDYPESAYEVCEALRPFPFLYYAFKAYADDLANQPPIRG